MNPKVRVVFDTQVFLRAVINPMSAAGRLIEERDSQYTLYVSQQIIAEILDVLTRSKIRVKFPQITAKHITFVKEKLNQAVLVEVSPVDIRPVCRVAILKMMSF